MFFFLAKTIAFFAVPSNAILTLGVLGALLFLTRFTRLAHGLTIASLALFALAGLSPLGNALMLPLENRFPLWDAARGAPSGIVVLGGAIGPETWTARGSPALNEAAERVTAVVALARRYPDARIIFTGGDASLLGGVTPEADMALSLFESLGIAPGRVTAESRSRDTYENAVFSREIAQPKAGDRWLLVTSAAHMPRSIGVFRQAGFAVDAYPVDFRTRGAADLLRPFTSVAGGLARTDAAVHEWLGLLAYRLAGRTDDLLPQP